jgi:hypothetical protein
MIQIPLKKKMYQLLYLLNPKFHIFLFSSFMVHNPMHQSGFCNHINCYMENKLPICKVALHSRAMELPTQEKFTCSPSKKRT